MAQSAHPGDGRRSPIDAFLPAWKVPRPLKLVIAAVLWPIMGVLTVVSGAFGLAAVVIVAVLVICIVIVLGAGGVEGTSYLVQHPSALVPHTVATTLALLVAVPLSIWTRSPCT